MTQPLSPDQEQALPPSQIEELLHLLVKGQRAHQLYLPNNPVYQQAMDRLRESFRKVWEATDDLVLDIHEAELKWEGHVVYASDTRSESIAWVLFKDGVRRLTLLPGVEEVEIVGLLDVIQRARNLTSDASDDLLTLLWEKDFQRLTYYFQEIVTESGGPELPRGAELQAAATSPASVRTAVEEETRGESVVAEGDAATEEAEEQTLRRSGIVRTDDFDTTLYFLDEQEIAYIRQGVAAEYEQDLRRNVLSMLLDILELQPFPTVRTEILSILDNFLPYLLGASDFGSVGYLLRETRVVQQRARELTPEHRQVLEHLPVRLSEEQALGQLLQALNEAAAPPSPDELAQLFDELHPGALPTLFLWLPRLTSASLREVLERAVRKLAAANAGTVAECLQASDANAVAAAARVAGLLKLAPTVPALAQALGHAEPVVRVAVVQALAEIASPAALQGLERALDDSDREVRLASVRVIAQHRSKSALPRIAAVVQGKTVRNADLTEKMAFFEAYGMMVGDAGIELLDAILSGGGFLKKKADAQTRACAAMALGRIGSEGARASLQKAVADKEPLVKNAVTRALRGDRMSTMLRAGEIPQ